MTQKIKLYLVLLVIAFTVQNGLPQAFDCNYIGSTSTTDNTGLFIGRVKPNRTTLSGDSASPPYAHFPVLIVFVQFQDDNSYSDWPNGGKPIYLDSLIAAPDQYNNQTDWWDAYNEQTQIYSDHYMELSRGVMHILGKAYSVVLSGNRSSYTDEFNMNQEIIDSLTAQDVDWDDYDRWSYDTTTNKFYYIKDNIVDMIFRVVKSRAPGMLLETGYNAFGWYSDPHMIVQNGDTTFIEPRGGYKNSGVTGSTYLKKSGYLSLFRHELGHQMFSNGHCTYSSVSYGFGFDGFYSPNDMYINEYMKDTIFNFDYTEFKLGDYSSRSSNFTGNMLRVNIDDDEHFTLVNRSNLSYWDVAMLGDSPTIYKFQFKRN